MVFFLAGGEGTRGIGNTATLVALDGVTPACSSLPDLPEDRRGPATVVDPVGNVLLCGGFTVSLGLCND